jgi:hypothetical protein
MPSALARFSTCRQTGAGKRIERGTVGPVSVPLRGRPGATWNRPSAAMRAAYGLGRSLTLVKSNSGISRSDAAEGSLILRAFFIASPLVSGRPPSADEPDRVLVDLHVNHEQQAAAVRLPEQNQPFWLLDILCDACERVIEHGF